MDARRKRYLDAMGIQTWERRGTAPAARDEIRETKGEEASPSSLASRPSSLAAGDVAELDWSELRERVRACELCPELAASRTQTVFGVGDEQAQWMVVGEAPGADEDRQGEPFVGRAGKLLNAMLRAAGFGREQVYIANVLKSRPPGNRDPSPAEVAHCLPYLRRQIALIQPRIILVVGRIAAQNLLQTDQPIGRLRGRLHTLPGTEIPVVVTYHPAYLLRSPDQKGKAWEDLRLALATFRNV